MTPDNWQLTTDTFFELINVSKDQYLGYHYTGLRAINSVDNIFNTPFFRKWIQSQCDLVTQRFHDQDNRTRKSIVAPINRIYQLADAISAINRIWPDTPIDYYQNHLDVLLGICRLYEPDGPLCKAWLREHMPVASLFQIMNKYYTEKLLDAAGSENRRRWDWDEDTDHWLFRFHELNDTFSMLARIFDHGKTIDPPRRWRITEFHDHVQSENWKIQNPNYSLPQDLFPQPIKVIYQDDNWSFFQPIDTHQLAQWGQAVRNCVGNAASYAEGVCKKQHFIVLGMLNGKPTFTIQLKVNMGVMSVEQIVGFANTRLSDTERDTYTKVFSNALRIRDEQLKSDR
jgi:hypothetical protein